MKQHVFFVQMQSQVLAAQFFERYVRYFGSLHPAFEMSCDTEHWYKQVLIFSETWSSSFCIVCNCFDDFRTNLPKNNGRSQRKENTNSPKWRWVNSKNVCLSSALLFYLVVTGKIFWELPEVSLLGTKRVSCSNAESRFGCASFRRLRLVIWLFTSCVWEVWRCRILIKTAFEFFRKLGLRRFVLCAIVLIIFVQTFEKKLGDFTKKKTPTFKNDVEYVPKLSVWALLGLFLWL